MPFEYDAQDAEMPQTEHQIPEGEYVLRITKAEEGKSKNGDYQVTCNLAVVEGEHKGFKVLYHRITFLNPKTHPVAAGISIHFVKTIGQPWQGKFEIKPGFWEGKCLLGYLVQDEYNGYKKMKIKWVKALEKSKAEGLEEIPF